MSKAWMITGVSSGLGRALALAAAERGDRVVGTVRTQADLEAFEAAAPGRATGVIADVTDEAAVHAAAARAEAVLGGIDILINNAGRGLGGAIEETPLEEVRALFESNLFGAIAAIQAVLPAMRARRAGHIVNISSISGFMPWSGTGIYCATKFAMEGIGQTLAQELAPLGIKVTNVQPGGLRTEFTGGSMRRASGDIADYAVSAHNAPRLLANAYGKENGDPAKAAQAILMLVDAETPPLNLLLGADAVNMATRRIAGLLGDLGRWAPISESIGFGTPAPLA